MECDEDEEEGEGEDTPPNLMSQLHLMLTGAGEKLQFPLLTGVTKRTAQTIKLYGLYSCNAGEQLSLSSLFTPSTFPDSAVAEWEQLLEKTSSTHERVVLGMVAEGLTREDLASLPVGVALPLWDSIFNCRVNPPPSDDLRLYELIEREDIVKTLSGAAADMILIESADKDDGMTMDNEIIKLTFLRVNEVKWSGHLSSLLDFELFDYLQDKHELTTVAVLLGITASRVGLMQRSIASILSIFVPPLLPFGSADMDLSQTIQTAALTAMGLLYLGSGNRPAQ